MSLTRTTQSLNFLCDRTDVCLTDTLGDIGVKEVGDISCLLLFLF